MLYVLILQINQSNICFLMKYLDKPYPLFILGILMKVKVKLLSVSDSLHTPWTAAHQAPLSMEFFRQEYWNGEPCPSPGDLPDPGIKARSSAWQADSSPLTHQASPSRMCLNPSSPADVSPPPRKGAVWTLETIVSSVNCDVTSNHWIIFTEDGLLESAWWDPASRSV